MNTAVHFATPPTSGALPQAETTNPLSGKVVEPVGASPLTAAGSCTFWLSPDGFGDEVTVVLVGARRTGCGRIGDLLARFRSSPEYSASMAWIPIGNGAAAQTALPLINGTCEQPPMIDESLRKLTLPL